MRRRAATRDRGPVDGCGWSCAGCSPWKSEPPVTSMPEMAGQGTVALDIGRLVFAVIGLDRVEALVAPAARSRRPGRYSTGCASEASPRRRAARRRLRAPTALRAGPTQGGHRRSTCRMRREATAHDLRRPAPRPAPAGPARVRPVCRPATPRCSPRRRTPPGGRPSRAGGCAAPRAARPDSAQRRRVGRRRNSRGRGRRDRRQSP